MAEWNKQEVPGELTAENNLYNFGFLEDGAHESLTIYTRDVTGCNPRQVHISNVNT